MEKRRHKRYTKRLEAKVFAGDSQLSAITSDISERGIFIRTQRGFLPGSVVDIEIYLPGNKVCRIRGTVKRTVKTPLPTMKNGMGIEIIDATKDSCYIEFFENFVIDKVRPETDPSREPPDAPEPVILACPFCGVKNRVMRDKLSRGPKCGKCGGALRTGDIV